MDSIGSAVREGRGRGRNYANAIDSCVKISIFLKHDILIGSENDPLASTAHHMEVLTP